MSDAQTFIKETVTNNPVVLFMKGTAQFPQCGFLGGRSRSCATAV